MIRWIFSAALSFLFCFVALGQRIAFTHLGVENGLSQNSVLAIAQDSRGFMWFGNRFGLNRYDGHSFRLYKQAPEDTTTLSNDYINALLTDSRSTLWIGTANGLNKYDPEKDIFERVRIDVEGGWDQYSPVNCLYEDHRGHLWVGTSHGVLVRTDTGGRRFIPFYESASGQGISGNNVRAIYEDHDGAVWIGSTTGLTRMRLNKGVYEFQTFRHNGTGTISDNYVTTIVEDSMNPRHLWIGTQNGGLNLYDPSTETFSVFTPAGNFGGIISNIRKIITDKKGNLWIGTQEGLSIVDPATRTCNSYNHDPGDKQSLSQNSIYSIFRDAGGSIWIGTYFGGVNITYSHATPFNVYESSQYHPSISNNVISAITEDRNRNLWIGTEGGGLNYFNRTTGSFTAFRKTSDPSSLGSNLVKTVYQDREGNIWAGTAHGGGLNLFDPVHKRFKRFLHKENDAESLTSEIGTIMEDDSGRLWVGSQTGLQIFDKLHGDLKPYTNSLSLSAPAREAIKVLFEDSKKNIWVATTAGLYLSGPAHHEFRSILINRGDSSINANFINCIQEDSRGRIWLGTYYEGLGLYDTISKKILSYTEKDGLPNNNVMGILEDQIGSLWLSTANGLSRFDPDNKTFRNYNSSDGLNSNEFNYNSFFKDSHGEMFFGGYNGFVGFFPDRIETNNYVAPIVFTSLKLFNVSVGPNQQDGLLSKDIGYTRHITFHYDQDVFTLGFALLNYIKPNKNRYAYKLEGFDKGWNEVTVASATYTNLPPGDYTFLVRGANNDGVWTTPAALQITVLPPFWKTWWAYCLYVLALGALLFLLIRYFFLQEVLKREDVLHQAKLNFFTNISHEIRTHLALIIGPVGKLLLHKKDEEDIRELRYIKKNSESLLQLVNELMDFRKAESGNLQLHVVPENIVAFINEIYVSFQPLSISRKISIGSTIPLAPIELYFDREQLEKVFFNLLFNAFKFTPDGGAIRVHIEDNGSAVDIKIIDNGKGIAAENLDKLFLNYYQENDYGAQNTGYGIGLALSQSIVGLHKGKLSVESRAGKEKGTDGGKENRTCFTVTLLKGAAHFSAAQLLPAGIPEEVPAFRDRMEEPLLDEGEGKGLEVTEPSGMEEPEIKKSILLVEDNPELRVFIRDSLSGQYQVMESVNGAKGWECAVESIPDLIISDVMMPEMDGYALCGRLKSDERTSHIPLILLTAKTSTANQVNGLGMGADSYLTKPFNIHVLELQVRNLLAAREMMRKKFGREFILQPRNIVINTLDEQFLDKAIRFIEDNMEDPEFGVQTLATHMMMSQPVLYKKTKALTDMSVNDFIKSIRLKKAAQLLQQRILTVNEIAYTVGYSDRKYFSKEFKKQFGKTPSEYAGSIIN